MTGEPGRQGGGTGVGRRALPLVARAVGWLIVPLYVAGVCASVLLERAAGLQNETSLAENVEGVLLTVGFGAFAVVGAILLVKRPGNLIGWIMAAIAFMLSVFEAGGNYAAYVMVTRGQPNALAVVGAWTFNWFWFLFLALALVYLPMLFPDGRLLSRRWLPVAVFAGIPPLSVVVSRALMERIPVLLNNPPGSTISNPIGIEVPGNVESLATNRVLFDALFVVGIVGVVASVVVRFRRSRGVERQQMKWFVSAIVALVGGPAFASSFSELTGVRWLEDLGFVLSLVGLVSLPVAVGIAILRYRLYDIDVVINRTLVYGVLTVSLGLVYIGGVISLQGLLRALTGQGSQLAIVASTLAIAALFNPMRRRIQSFIDRRFYRSKYDAAKALEGYSARLRDEVDIETLESDLVSVIRETVQPDHTSLWLKPPNVRAKR